MTGINEAREGRHQNAAWSRKDDARRLSLKLPLSDLSLRNAALVVGIAFVVSALIVTLVDDFILGNFVVPGDTAALAGDIRADPSLLVFAAIGYLIVLVLDSMIGLALYVVLRPAGKHLAMLTGALRLLYAGILTAGVLGLLFQLVDVFDYASIRLLGYLFFAAHIFALGFSVLRSTYIPSSLGALLIVASLSYAAFFVDVRLSEAVGMLIMLTMAIAELALSVWLVMARNRLEIESGSLANTT